MKRNEFISVFKITKTVMFEVRYYTLGNNSNPYFITSTMEFIRSKRNFKRIGQCQEKVLPKGIAKDFFKKWEKKHLLDLTNEEYKELMQDVEILKNNYKNIFIQKETFKNKNSNINFYVIKKLSMEKK